MLLVSSKFANDKVTIDDSSPEGTTRIHVVFDKGKLVTAGFFFFFFGSHLSFFILFQF